jgi:hypothetical protein
LLIVTSEHLNEELQLITCACVLFLASLYNFEAPGNVLVIVRQRVHMSSNLTSRNELKKVDHVFDFVAKHRDWTKERGRSNIWILNQQ